MTNQRSLRCLSPIFWHETYALKRIWSIRSSTPARSGWHGSSFYWRISAKKENRSPVIAKVNQETLAEMIGTLASS